MSRALWGHVECGCVTGACLQEAQGFSFRGFRNLVGSPPPEKTILEKGREKRKEGDRNKKKKKKKKNARLEMGALTSLRKGHLEWMEQVSAVTPPPTPPPEEKRQNNRSVQEGTEQPWKGRSVRLDTQAACGRGTQDCAARSRKRQSCCRVPKSPSH